MPYARSGAAKSEAPTIGPSFEAPAAKALPLSDRGYATSVDQNLISLSRSRWCAIFSPIDTLVRSMLWCPRRDRKSDSTQFVDPNRCIRSTPKPIGATSRGIGAAAR